MELMHVEPMKRIQIFQYSRYANFYHTFRFALVIYTRNDKIIGIFNNKARLSMFNAPN